MDFYQRALELREETVAHRRWLHSHAEVGLDMPNAQAYVMEQLRKSGLDPRPCGHGVTAELGRGRGGTLLLRADMDALPMPEESGEPFACPTGTEAHACGHDFHAAMLLTAAKLLKKHEAMLSGRVRFMFQTAEETFEGAKDMIANGILDGVDGALAYHVGSGRMPVGLFMYNSGGTMRHTPKGTTLYFGRSADADRAVLTLANSGPGIPGELAQDIFIPFVMGDATRGGMGAGLGLSIAKRIGEAHNGSIRLAARSDSRWPPVFEITLPIQTA